MCRGFAVDPHIGAAELKKKLFNGIREEWTVVNNGHHLKFDQLQLSTSDLIEICPPTDGRDDVNCLARWLYKPSKKSSEPTLTIPKAPLQLLFTMNSKDFAAFTEYFNETEKDKAFQANLAMAGGGGDNEEVSEVTYVRTVTRHKSYFSLRSPNQIVSKCPPPSPFPGWQVQRSHKRTRYVAALSFPNPMLS